MSSSSSLLSLLLFHFFLLVWISTRRDRKMLTSLVRKKFQQMCVCVCVSSPLTVTFLLLVVILVERAFEFSSLSLSHVWYRIFSVVLFVLLHFFFFEVLFRVALFVPVPCCLPCPRLWKAVKSCETSILQKKAACCAKVPSNEHQILIKKKHVSLSNHGPNAGRVQLIVRVSRGSQCYDDN